VDELVALPHRLRRRRRSAGANECASHHLGERHQHQGVDTPTLTNNALGNDELKPERTTELEGGFEMKMLNNRLSLDVTAYQKRTKDALIAAVIAPSVGTGATDRAAEPRRRA
jgi:outer membrane receptor for monomeric catechols